MEEERRRIKGSDNRERNSPTTNPSVDLPIAPAGTSDEDSGDKSLSVGDRVEVHAVRQGDAGWKPGVVTAVNVSDKIKYHVAVEDPWNNDNVQVPFEPGDMIREEHWIVE